MLQTVSVQNAWNHKYPEQVVCTTCGAFGDDANIIPLGWFMPTSFSPPMCAISVGHTRHSHKLIEQYGEFVVFFPVEGQEEDVLYCGSSSGKDVDKFADTDFTARNATEVGAPLVEEGLVNLECIVAGSLETGDHTIFSGRIVAAHVNDEAGVRIYNMGNGHVLEPIRPQS